MMLVTSHSAIANRCRAAWDRCDVSARIVVVGAGAPQLRCSSRSSTTFCNRMGLE